jgi:hypothetical protein
MSLSVQPKVELKHPDKRFMMRIGMRGTDFEKPATELAVVAPGSAL